ncbi:hypothetical protein AB0E64_40890 [Streptomyces caelestis]
MGPRQADALRDYGIPSVGLVAAVPAATVQRLLGGRAGRLATDRARGIDPRPAVPRSLPESVTVRRSARRGLPADGRRRSPARPADRDRAQGEDLVDAGQVAQQIAGRLDNPACAAIEPSSGPPSAGASSSAGRIRSAVADEAWLPCPGPACTS